MNGRTDGMAQKVVGRMHLFKMVVVVVQALFQTLYIVSIHLDVVGRVTTARRWPKLIDQAEGLKFNYCRLAGRSFVRSSVVRPSSAVCGPAPEKKRV